MAQCCRLEVELASGAVETAFLKRSSMRDLPHARAKFLDAPAKLTRDVKSYAVEAAFLRSGACELLREFVGCPTVKYVRSRAVDAFPLDSAFLLLMEDFGRMRQEPVLGRSDLEAAVEAAARFHAFFWNGRVGKLGSSAPIAKALDASVWDVGTWWAPKRQAAGMLETVGAAFAAADIAGDFEDRVPGLGDLGDRLQATNRSLAAETHLYVEGATSGLLAGWAALHPHRTLLHGDLKAPNLFFGDDGDCALIDFQWCGWGLGATDLAYLVVAAADPGLLADPDLEASLLSVYRAELGSHLVRFGAARDPAEAAAMLTEQELREEYETALLDHCSTVFGYLWKRGERARIAARAEDPKLAFAANAYMKDPRAAAWLLATAKRLLDKRSIAAAPPPDPPAPAIPPPPPTLAERLARQRPPDWGPTD